ncbi:unnamed protein product [Adineta ricciae]|uniref:Uncharacterized protein n=1 Tax=Adineta ricciae TaxID=249248 RepID=A0A815DYW9_ADIRI|nr:unnamed protein product [Adineta ricciae]CAF1509123.1 unnamed protein product [Adineta ricciae]
MRESKYDPDLNTAGHIELIVTDEVKTKMLSETVHGRYCETRLKNHIYDALESLTHSATPNVTEIECINPKYSYEAMDIETNHVAEQVNENDDTTLANSPNAPIR